jgi:uncharacterized cofD-like protein
MSRPGNRNVVAFGGGHGLSASLRALAALSDRVPGGLDITAVVTVGDDGGSSGRLRTERGALPPGDLRQALAALAGPAAGDVAHLLQHRFQGVPGRADPLAGHAVGNLVLCGLFEMYGDPVVALEHAAAMVSARGRVLPMSPVPIGIEADIRAVAESPGTLSSQVRTLIGQHSVAIAEGRVEAVRLSPIDPPACAEAVHAVARADWLIFGPGSWYTSVIPHLLVPDLAKSILASSAKRLVILNLAVEKETKGLSLSDHLKALTRYLPGLHADVVLADDKAVGDPDPVQRAARSLGARLVLAPVAMDDGSPQHDPSALTLALAPLLVGK